MKELFKLDKIVLTDSTKGKGLRVEFVPKKDVYSKSVRLVFSGDNCTQVLENFDMPVGVGDIIELDFKTKNIQTSLTSKNGKVAV